VARALSPAAQALERPVLDLSGPVLLKSFEQVLAACEATGGVEAYVDALKLKSLVFQRTFEQAGATGPDAATFAKLASLMPTVRRRIGAYLGDSAYPQTIAAVMRLIGERHDPFAVDARVATFCAAFPSDSAHRWVRDLAAEVLHAHDPERYPLMCRWVWDVRANTGVLREIWHGDIDRQTLKIPDGYATFVMLREELSQFLAQNGVFHHVLHYVDLICAQAYADYVCAQGGSYLRADFSSAEDPIGHVRRLLGLDGVRAKGAFRQSAHALLGAPAAEGP